jgi:hypothetical protein
VRAGVFHGGCLFSVEDRVDGVFGSVLVTLWYALVMCWVLYNGGGGGCRLDGDEWTSKSGKAQYVYI